MKTFFKKNNYLKGFTLVETLVAVSILSLSMVGGMVLLGQGISDIGHAKKKVVASYLAQESIESIRNMRDAHVLYGELTSETWNGFRSEIASCNSINPCGFDNTLEVTDNEYVFQCSAHSSGCNLFVDDNASYNVNLSGQSAGFVRTIWFDTSASDEVQVFTRVSWSQGSGTYSVVLSEVLFNWVE